MDQLRVHLLPGFQSDTVSTEIALSGTECVRLVREGSGRKEREVFSSFGDDEVCGRLLAEFSELDWPLIIGVAEGIGIDDVDFHFFEGDFGKVTIPLGYATREANLREDQRKKCVLLSKLVGRLFALPFGEGREEDRMDRRKGNE